MGADFNAKAYGEIYKHSSWEREARSYEDRFAANLYKSSYVQQAAKTALTKLSKMLNAYYTPAGPQRPPVAAGGNQQEEAENIASLFQVAGEVTGEKVEITDTLMEALLAKGDSSGGAGQIGSYAEKINERSNDMDRQVAVEGDRRNLDALINGSEEDANLRERMTLLYNGLFINGGRGSEQIAQSQSLKNMMAYITEQDIENHPELAGVRLDLLDQMEKRKSHGDVFDTFAIARDLKKAEDKATGKGNKITRFFAGIKRAFNAALSSKFTRKTRSRDERERRGLGEQHYNSLGIPLSDREKWNGIGADGQLKWREGSAWYEMKEPVTADGMVQTAGPSGTTLRMLGAYKLMGASAKELLQFRLALIAWMVTSHDHSLYEILKGSHNAGVQGEEDLSEPAKMYMSVDPLPIDVLRQEFAPDKRFPHETVYRIMLNELRDKRRELAEEKNQAVLAKDWRTGLMVNERSGLKENLEALVRATATLREKKRVADREVAKLKQVQNQSKVLINMLVRQGHISKEAAEEYSRMSPEELVEQGVPERLAHKSADIGMQELGKRLTKVTVEYRKGKADQIKLKNDIEVYEKQQEYVRRQVDVRREELLKHGYQVTEGNDFALFGKSSAGVMSGLEGDAQRGDAQDLALNIYTTGAFLTMTRGQKYWGGFGKSAMSDERVDQSWKTGFGSYENSSSLEMKDSELADSIYNMIRVSSRMAQDALEERGQTVDENAVEAQLAGAGGPGAAGTGRKNAGGAAMAQAAASGREAFVGPVYRGGRLSGTFRASEESIITIGSLMSSSKHLSKAAEYYQKSSIKEGEDNAVLIEYKMTGKGSVDISGLSKVASEGEVLIPASTRFKVAKALRKAEILESGINWNAASAEGEDKAKSSAGKEGTGAGESRRKLEFPMYGYVVQLEEVEGPGSARRNAAGQVADMRREVREMYRQTMLRRRNAVPGGGA